MLVLNFSTIWTSVNFSAMHYVYFVAARGTENTWMLIELIVNHSWPLLLCIVCMKQTGLLLILWHISSWLILHAKKKQSAWRTVSKPILPPSSSPSCYFAFQNIYFVCLYTKIPDFVIREKQKCEKIVFLAIRCRYVQIVENFTIFIAYFHLRLLQWQTSNACWLWLLAKISQPFFSFYLSDVFYEHSDVNLFIHH